MLDDRFVPVGLGLPRQNRNAIPRQNVPLKPVEGADGDVVMVLQPLGEKGGL
jgi:hypothetical protein